MIGTKGARGGRSSLGGATTGALGGAVRIGAGVVRTALKGERSSAARRRKGKGMGASAREPFSERLAAWKERAAERLAQLLPLHRGPVEVSEALKVAKPALGPDRLFCGAVLVLAALGVVMVYSAGAAFSAKTYGDGTYFLKREAIYALVGLVAFSYGLRTDYAAYRRMTYPLLFLSVVALAAVLIVGTKVAGATRWFRIGPLSFQPSELAKFSLALYLAVLLARKAEKVREFSVGFLPPLIMTGLVCGLLLLEPDLGTAVVIGLMALGLLFVAGTRTSYILIALLVAVPVGWKFLIAGTPWRMRRILAFLNPWQYRQNESYQLFESLISFGSGGLTGQGLGASKQKLFFLPEAHTDFILAIVGEELGFLGLLCVLATFGVLVWRGLVAATRARDVFGSYLAFAITLLFGLQALMNMAVVLGLMPTKGIPLPFVSYGGTSLVVSLFMAGVVGNISARNPEPKVAALLPFLGATRPPPSKNKRASSGARVVVLTGARKRAPQASVAAAPPPSASPEEPVALSPAAPAPTAPLDDTATAPDERPAA